MRDQSMLAGPCDRIVTKGCARSTAAHERLPPAEMVPDLGVHARHASADGYTQGDIDWRAPGAGVGALPGRLAMGDFGIAGLWLLLALSLVAAVLVGPPACGWRIAPSPNRFRQGTTGHCRRS